MTQQRPPGPSAPRAPPRPERYTAPAVALHWVLAVALATSFGVGLYMADLPFSPQRVQLYNWHKWAGVTLLALSAVRLIWRLTHRPPAPPPMPAWQRRSAHAVHLALYALCFAVPLIGWAYSSAAGFPIVWFGVLPLPDFVPVDRDLADALKPWHEISAWALATLVVLHLAGALKHHFIDRDGLIGRMAFGRNESAP